MDFALSVTQQREGYGSECEGRLMKKQFKIFSSGTPEAACEKVRVFLEKFPEFTINFINNQCVANSMREQHYVIVWYEEKEN